MKFTATIFGPFGSSVYLHLQADDMEHARELARDEGLSLFGAREFSFTVREA